MADKINTILVFKAPGFLVWFHKREKPGHIHRYVLLSVVLSGLRLGRGDMEVYLRLCYGASKLQFS